MLLLQFKGEKAVDPVTGKPTLYFPEREYFMRLAFRYCTLCTIKRQLAFPVRLFGPRSDPASPGLPMAARRRSLG